MNKKRNFYLDKRGELTLLQEYLIFILVNLLFFAVFALFIYSKSNGANVLEEKYAKNIALLIDASIPIMKMKLNMEDAFDVAEKNKVSRDEIVKISGNQVIVNLGSSKGYSYRFFNNFAVTAYADSYPNKNYLINVNGYN
jgi:hypothetical protein